MTVIPYSLDITGLVGYWMGFEGIAIFVLEASHVSMPAVVILGQETLHTVHYTEEGVLVLW